MSDHELNDKQRPMGFAGLATMVSSVDDIVSQEVLKAENTKEPGAPANVGTLAGQHNDSSSPAVQSVLTTSSEKKDNKSRNWIIAVIGILAVIWFINRPNSSSNYTASNSTSQVTNVPTPAPVQPVVQAPPEDTSITEKPPVGKNLVLNRAQLRYCQAEKIRLEAGREELSTNVNPSYTRFNKFVDDFNVRCSKYRYYQQDLDKAISDVQERLYQYQSEGRVRFQHSR